MGAENFYNFAIVHVVYVRCTVIYGRHRDGPASMAWLNNNWADLPAELQALAHELRLIDVPWSSAAASQLEPRAASSEDLASMVCFFKE